MLLEFKSRVDIGYFFWRGIKAIFGRVLSVYYWNLEFDASHFSSFLYFMLLRSGRQERIESYFYCFKGYIFWI